MSRSREEALSAGVKVRETQHSMKRRKPWHNYRHKGTYMLTMVVEGRQPVLGKLIIPTGGPTGVAAIPPPASFTASVPAPSSAVPTPAGSPAGPSSASPAASYIELTPLGTAIRDKEIQKISAIYNMVKVWKFCIMPDHIHMIVRITEDLPEGKHLGHIVAGFKGGCSRTWWRMTEPRTNAQGVETATTPAATAPAATTPAATAPAATAPAATTPAASAAGSAAGLPSLFEAGYNDLILLDDGQLDNWKHYLDDNPRRLAIKRQHPDLFTTLNYADIGEWHCQLVGNRFLLDIPQKVAVIVHGAYTDKDYADYREKWLACGEAGSILVSAAIATREKEVMREAMNRGYRMILVRENGFPPLYKPSGESFDACSEGRLLQVSPWEYHMKRRIISREQCLKLNRLVEDIVAYVPVW